MGRPQRLTRGRREAAFWAGLASLFVLTTAVGLVGWAVVPAWLPGWESSVVESGSMAPRIRTGDVVVWSHRRADDLGEGSVAVFRDEVDRRVVHRIVGRDPDGSLRTKGDANPDPDPDPVPARRVEGAGRVLVPLVGLPRLWVGEGRWWELGALATVLAGAAALSRLTWAADFDPWLAAPAHLGSAVVVGDDPHPAARPLWLAGAATLGGVARATERSLFPPEARAALLAPPATSPDDAADERSDPAIEEERA